LLFDDDPDDLAWLDYKREHQPSWNRMGDVLLSDIFRWEAERAFRAGMAAERDKKG
jgi:hypothetical protein